jgi:glycosyltransferase involved in cell wall biosynthesis
MDITVIIPTIPSRKESLYRAVESVGFQTKPATNIIIQADLNREGSAETRNRALKAVRTPWVAFLDDDDSFLPHHLERLSQALSDAQADVAYPLPLVLDKNGRKIPRQRDWGGGPEFSGETLEQRSYINICSVVRTELAVGVGGFEFVRGSTGQLNDDHGFYLKLYRAGAKFVHVHEPTFIWNHHGGNTSGQPGKGDAA